MPQVDQTKSGKDMCKEGYFWNCFGNHEFSAVFLLASARKTKAKFSTQDSQMKSQSHT